MVTFSATWKYVYLLFIISIIISTVSSLTQMRLLDVFSETLPVSILQFLKLWSETDSTWEAFGFMVGHDQHSRSTCDTAAWCGSLAWCRLCKILVFGRKQKERSESRRFERSESHIGLGWKAKAVCFESLAQVDTTRLFWLSFCDGGLFPRSLCVFWCRRAVGTGKDCVWMINLVVLIAGLCLESMCQ